MFSYTLIVKAGLVILGVWWCKDVLERWRSDVAELKESDDRVRRCVIVFIWLVTLLIAASVAWFVWSGIAHIVREFR